MDILTEIIIKISRVVAVKSLWGSDPFYKVFCFGKVKFWN